MTGYGSASVPIPAGRVTVEVRAVNQRFLDVRVTAPREYGPWEAECRETVRAHVARGRVEVHVSRGAPPRRAAEDGSCASKSLYPAHNRLHVVFLGGLERALVHGFGLHVRDHLVGVGALELLGQVLE